MTKKNNNKILNNILKFDSIQSDTSSNNIQKPKKKEKIKVNNDNKKVRSGLDISIDDAIFFDIMEDDF